MQLNRKYVHFTKETLQTIVISAKIHHHEEFKF
jgi:hypothetical protein